MQPKSEIQPHCSSVYRASGRLRCIYYRELTRENGKVKSVRQYDISTLFTLDGIVDMAAEADLPDKQKFISVMLHPDREV
jgi:hypothetical protein